jgi:NAD(P)-dependent dehydrogenase (short-subunit alcohol dehydrogenase family)
MPFSGKHIIITGGTGALGRAVTATLLKQGAHCVVPYVHEVEAKTFPRRDDANVQLISVHSLADEREVARVYRAPKGPLWASIHLAGGFAKGKIADIDKASLMKQIDDNLVSCFLCCRRAVDAIGNAGGRIVNVAARPALEWRSGSGMTAYTIAKTGVAALTVALAEEVAKINILVNAVAPSVMDTPANRAGMPKADHTQWPTVEQVAATILFLASAENHVTRGAVVPVYGKT